MAVLFGAILIYQWAYLGPARRRQARFTQAIEAAWQQFKQSRPAADIAPVGKKFYEKAQKAFADGRTDTALQQSKALEELARLPGQLEKKRKQILEEAREKSARKQAQSLYRQGHQALADGRIDDAQQIYRKLSQLLNRLQQQFVLQIVSRPNEPSGIWRIPANNPSARNYYIIVEAVTPQGDRLTLPITSEEDGQTHMVNKWGMRVSADFFNKIRQDKMDDGIIQNRRFGQKKRGYLKFEYFVPTTGDAITKW